MSVVIETTAGDLTVDLFTVERPRACQNFLKLCALKYYNYHLFHTIQQGFIAQTGDPSGVGDGGASVWSLLESDAGKRYFQAEAQPRIRHSDPGLLSMVSSGDGGMVGSQFFFTLGPDLSSLDDGGHCVIGQVVEGLDALRKLNETICDADHRPYQDVRITHTVILEDPFGDPRGFRAPSRSPSPSAERLRGGRIAADEDVDDTDGKTEQEVAEMRHEREAKARATILEIVGDLPDADMAPPENVLFVCKLNPVTSDDDLEIIFSRFGRVKACEVIRDRVTGDSLQYAFVEFEDAKTCESAYFKMDNVLIDDRRIHVDFSQSVAKVQWRGKGRGLIYGDGQKRDRLDFGDLKARGAGNGAGQRGGGGGGGGGGRGGKWQQNQRQTPSEGSRPEQGRERRKSVDRSAANRDRDREQRQVERPRSRGREQRGSDREQRQVERPRSRDRDREQRKVERPRSRDRDREQRKVEHPRSRDRRHSRSPERQRRDDNGDRSIGRDQHPRRKSRSPAVRQRQRSHSREAIQKPAADKSLSRHRSRSPIRQRERREVAAKKDSSSSEDSESDSEDSEDSDRVRRKSKKSKAKKSKKSKKKSSKSKKARKQESTDSESESDDSSESDDRSKRRNKKSKKKHKK